MTVLKSPLKGNGSFSIRGFINSNKAAGKSDKSTASLDSSSGGGNSATGDNHHNHPSTPLTAKYSDGSSKTASTAPLTGRSSAPGASKSAPGRTSRSKTPRKQAQAKQQRLGEIELPIYSEDITDASASAAIASSPNKKTVKVPSKAATDSSPSSKKGKDKLKAKKASGVGAVKKVKKVKNKDDAKASKKKKKKTSTTATQKSNTKTKCNDDEDYPSDSEEEVEDSDDGSGDDKANASANDRPPPPERTWSISAFSTTMSVGDNTIGTNLYVEDASSYCDSEEDDDESEHEDDALTTTKKKKKKNKDEKSPVRRMTKKQREKQRAAEQRAAAALRALSQSPKSGPNDGFGLGDRTKDSPFSLPIKSPSSGSKNKKKGKRKTKVSEKVRKQSPPLDEISFDSAESDDDDEENGGYDSDGVLSRKKNLVRKNNRRNREGKKTKNSRANSVIIDFEFKDIADAHKSEPGKKRGVERRNSTGTIGSTVVEKETKKLDRNDAIKALRAAAAAAAAAEEARAAAAGSDEEYLMDDDEAEAPASMASLPVSSLRNIYDGSSDDIIGGSKAGKEDAKLKMKEIDDYFRKVDTSDDLSHYGCNMSVATGRSGIEALEQLLLKGRNDEMQKEREAIAFERESLELQLSDEIQKNEELTMQILELEQQLQSQQYSNSNDVRGHQDWEKEKEELKVSFEREKNELCQQLFDRDREIENLQQTLKDFELIQEKGPLSSDENEGKSKERLQGELLQALAKLSHKETRLEEQTRELEEIKTELAELALGSGVESFKEEIEFLKKEKRQLEDDRKAVKEDYDAKLKDKDDTITFLMGELAKLKQEQSKTTGSIGGILYPKRQSTDITDHSPFASQLSGDRESSLSRRGASLIKSLGFNNSFSNSNNGISGNLQMEKD